MTAVIVLSLLTASLIAIIEISTVLLRLTGMREDVARFQAVSLLSRTGFTTTEAELIAQHPRRRSIGMGLMAGSLMAVVMVTSLVHGIIGEEIHLGALVVITGTAVVLLLAVVRSDPFKTYLGARVRAARHKFPRPEELHLFEVFPVDDVHVLRNISVSGSDGMAGNRLADLELSKEGIQVLQVSSDGIVRVAAPDGSTRIEAGDRLLVYGARSRIDHLARQSGRSSGHGSTPASGT